MRTVFALWAAFPPVPIMAQERMRDIFRQPMEGVYFQDWSARVLGIRDSDGVEVHVVGDGKAGVLFA